MNIWIVEDDAGYRRNLRMSLEMEDDVFVGRVFPSCTEFFRALETDPSPDVVLMDMGLPGMSGIDALHLLAKTVPDLAVMILTVFQEKEKVLKAMDAGAKGYLLKESEAADIVNDLREMLAGGEPVRTVVAQTLSSELV